MSPLTEDEVRALLAPGEAVQDDLLLAVLDALRRAGHGVVITDAYGVGALHEAQSVHGGESLPPEITEEELKALFGL
ncbi:hypothetical protein [Nocardiopsis flavescens]